MYEVYLRLRFDAPCLGSVRGETDGSPDTMLRSPDGSVIIPQTYWRTIVCQGAKSYGKHQERVRGMLWTPSVDGTTNIFRRYYHLRSNEGANKKMFKDHEAFLTGDVIGVKALVPDDVPLEDLREIMTITGEYFGISPFGWKMGYGKFKVLEAMRTRREGQNEQDSNTVDQGKSSGRNSSESRD